MKAYKIFFYILLVVIELSIFNILGNQLNDAYSKSGQLAKETYDFNGNVVYSYIPIPYGSLSASSIVPLPDLYEEGKGFTCTGLAYDETTNTFLIGDIGTLLPGGTCQSQIVRLQTDLSTVVETIPLYEKFSNMGAIQGVTIDNSDSTIWFCSPDESKIRNISTTGVNIGSISVTRPTGIAYSAVADAFWVLTYENDILLIDKSGNILESYTFSYDETIDQCFLDESRGLLYITAGTNYTGRNNIYCFNTHTHEQSIACTVDSYSVEGIWLGDNDKMIILNDGYYHSAYVATNQANIYTID